MEIFSANTSVNFIDIPFELKDQYKKGLIWDCDSKCWRTKRFSALGIKWSNKYNKWYSDDDDDYKPLDVINTYKRIYLDVPFDDKDYVKENGARWDNNKKKWYTIASNYLLEKYMPNNYLYDALKSDFFYDEIEITKWKD
jgi:hypothetical protein